MYLLKDILLVYKQNILYNILNKKNIYIYINFKNLPTKYNITNKL